MISNQWSGQHYVELIYLVYDIPKDEDALMDGIEVLYPLQDIVIDNIHIEFVMIHGCLPKNLVNSINFQEKTWHKSKRKSRYV